MGELTVFQCRKCGYETPEIRWGVGQNDPRLRLMPGLCVTCHEIVEVDLTGRDILVEKFTHDACGSAVFFFKKGESYECPRCGAPDMRILQLGYW